MNKDKVFSLCAEMRQQDACDGIYLISAVCIFAGALP